MKDLCLSTLLCALMTTVCLAVKSEAQAPVRAQAEDLSSRRVNDLQVGTELLINLNDTELLSKGKHQWLLSTPGIQQRCEISTRSYFDEVQARKSGPTIYQVTQNNPQNATWGQTVRDQFTLLATTANKDLPLIMVDCGFDAKKGAHPAGGWTLGYVRQSMAQPQLFQKPVFSAVVTKLAVDFFPEIKTVKILSDLHFEGVANPNGGLSVRDARFQNGKLIPPTSHENAECRIEYSELVGGSLNPYNITVHAGQTFTVAVMQTAYLSIYRIVFDLQGQNVRLSLECYNQGGYSSFAQMAAHVAGILEFQK